MAPPRLEALGLTAAGMDALGLYAALLAVVDAKELVAGHVTVGLVQELAGLVHLKVNRWDTVPPSKLSVKEFCHVVVKLRSKEFAEPLLKRKRGAHAVPQHSGITDPQHSSTTVTEPRLEFTSTHTSTHPSTHNSTYTSISATPPPPPSGTPWREGPGHEDGERAGAHRPQHRH